MSRKKAKKIVDEALLDALFISEGEWKRLRNFIEKSVDPLSETRDLFAIAEAKYVFLLKEVKHRQIKINSK